MVKASNGQVLPVFLSLDGKQLTYIRFCFKESSKFQTTGWIGFPISLMEYTDLLSLEIARVVCVFSACILVSCSN